jgi:hypothetical protein
MLCNEVQDKLYEYIYEEFEKEEKTVLEKHLAHCDECSRKYRDLKKLLIDDMEDISNLAEKISMPQDLPQQISKRLKVNSTRRFSRFAAAACMLIFSIYAIPVAAYYTVENTVLSKYISFSQNLVQDIEDGKMQLVNKSAAMKDITFRVDGIIRKADKTTVLFTVKVPEGKKINYAMPSNSFNVINIADQFGTKYRSTGSAMSLRSANEDGEVTAIMDFEALKFWSYKLSINITAMDTGTIKAEKASGSDPRADENGFIYDITEDKTVYGSWKLDFYIDRTANK